MRLLRNLLVLFFHNQIKKGNALWQDAQPQCMDIELQVQQRLAPLVEEEVVIVAMAPHTHHLIHHRKVAQVD